MYPALPRAMARRFECARASPALTKLLQTGRVKPEWGFWLRLLERLKWLSLDALKGCDQAGNQSIYMIVLGERSC